MVVLRPKMYWRIFFGFLITIPFFQISSSRVALASNAPNGPGSMGTWARPDKSAYGTTLSSNVWFTMVDGWVSEIAFPYVDRLQTRESFLIIRSDSKVYSEKESFKWSVKRYPKSLAFYAKGVSTIGTIEKAVQVIPGKSALEIDYTLHFNDSRSRDLIFIHKPAAEQTQGGDMIAVGKDSFGEPYLNARQIDIRGDEPAWLFPFSQQTVMWSLKDSSGTVGFKGVNAPSDQIARANFPLGYSIARYGNVEGALHKTTSDATITFRVIIQFEKLSKSKLYPNLDLAYQGFKSKATQTLADAQAEWTNYLKPLSYDRNDSLEEASLLVLRACEDKTYKGALVASPANPAIPGYTDAPEHNYEDSRIQKGDSNAGYRRIWPRDLFHKALSFISVGDRKTAVDILNWYKFSQFKSGYRTGAWSQNYFSNGTPSWGAYQIDQVAFPISLVARLVELKSIDYATYRPMVLAAAQFIAIAGPNTDQERWEENGGLSPNSLAATVAALDDLAWLEKNYGSADLSIQYATLSNNWKSNLKNWLLIKKGALGENYFPRIELGSNGNWDPSQHKTFYIHNKAPGERTAYSEDQILDGGFLHWIMAGLVDPKDTDFGNTITLYDKLIRKVTPAGTGYLRYNEDAYGENHKGGAWPILSAERAIAGIERGEDYKAHLSFMQKSAYSTGMIPEQDTLSVSPLAWSHAAYLILKKSIRDNRSFYISQHSR